jgi:hypothetical protein
MRRWSTVNGLTALFADGRATWRHEERGWVANPEAVLDALTREGFVEYKREVTASRRDREPTGGVWQGLNARTGTVASAIWIQRPRSADALVVVDIDGERVEGA